MNRYVLGLEEVDRTHAPVVGGKGAHLGDLSRVEGIPVPPGFCVTADAYRTILANARGVDDALDRLSRREPGDREAIRTLSARIRHAIEGTDIPKDMAEAIARALTTLGDQAACAVRSSATAEDLPTASFAGQQDSYLNVIGTTAVLQHIRRCWASLFTERAVTYRLRNGFEHRRVHMAVVVQRMLFPQAAGILFTADPATGHRKVTAIEAVPGLGEAIVSGLVSADAYRVREGDIISRTVATKRLAIHASPDGGTQRQVIAPERQDEPVLTDAQAVQLALLGRRIEAHFGCPQDIEWCLADGEFHVVQSRPITTLYPVPEASDGENHVYVSVGHQQMMTDAMKPLGLSFWQLTSGRPMLEAGGRLFVDVTRALASPAGRAGLMGVLGRSDPLIGSALQAIVDRGDFVRPLPDEPAAGSLSGNTPAPVETDSTVVAELVQRQEAAIAALKREIRGKSGTALLDFILTDIQELKRFLFDPLSLQVIMAGMQASWWLNDQLQAWLGETNAADTLTRSVPGNVTSEMGLALLDVADVIRPHPAVVEFLQHVENDNFLDELPSLPGGVQARDAIHAWLDAYGMRGPGEIDLTRPRWTERPTLLLPILLGHVSNLAPGAAARRFEQGRQEAMQTEQQLLGRLRELPDGAGKAAATRERIDRVRTFAGYREYPKYAWMQRFFVYKQALLEEAERLVQADALREAGDVFYLTFRELRDVVETLQVDRRLLRDRQEAFRFHQTLTPPRVLTSDGEVVAGAYRRDDLPPGALVGLPVSSGTVEGRARVILEMADATLEEGDILVTVYTDPSWTPLFLGIRGLVTEVGGLMTHGAVIAREYGLPAVVGVEQATRLIRDGQWIRLNGTDGHVAIMAQPPGGV